jgi:bifunctional DNase/RNase
MTSPAQQQLIGLLERAGTDQQVREVAKALRRPSPRPAHLDVLEELIEEVSPDVAALVVVEAYRGGLAG